MTGGRNAIFLFLIALLLIATVYFILDLEPSEEAAAVEFSGEDTPYVLLCKDSRGGMHIVWFGDEGIKYTALDQSGHPSDTRTLVGGRVGSSSSPPQMFIDHKDTIHLFLSCTSQPCDLEGGLNYITFDTADPGDIHRQVISPMPLFRAVLDEELIYVALKQGVGDFEDVLVYDLRGERVETNRSLIGTLSVENYMCRGGRLKIDVMHNLKGDIIDAFSDVLVGSDGSFYWMGNNCTNDLTHFLRFTPSGELLADSNLTEYITGFGFQYFLDDENHLHVLSIGANTIDYMKIGPDGEALVEPIEIPTFRTCCPRNRFFHIQAPSAPISFDGFL